VLRILRIDSFRERIALSLKQVSEQERDGWLAQNTQDKTASTDQADSSISGSEQIATSSASEVEETTTTEPDQVTEDMPPKESMPATSDEPEDDNFWISLIEDEEVERV
jgi:hypothetical protein